MIRFQGVCKRYEEGNRALQDINITIDDGEFVFIMGRSGAGKSTLLRMLIKEVDPSEGQLIVNDTDLSKLPRRKIPKYRRTFGMVFQDFRLLKDQNVFENVAFALRVVGASQKTIRESVPEALKVVGLSAKYKYYPQQLSGGEQQRVAIARAIINNPEIILADEPTGNLDHDNAVDIMKLLGEINASGATVIVSTHSRELVDMMGKRVITLDHGHIIDDEVQEGGQAR